MIKNITICNFKGIKNLKIFVNEDFNVIIGKNNIGKTTIFEAIHLWKICYDANIQKSNKSLFYSLAKNINFSEMEYLRVFEDQDLINKDLYKENKDILISLEIELNNQKFLLGFQVTKVFNIDNAYFQVSYINKEEFGTFAQAVKNTEYNLANIIVICESKPMANIIAKEPYMYKDQVLDKISKGKGYEVLRNKVTKSQEHREKIEEHIRNVMEKEYVFTEVDKDKKTYIKLLVNGTNILSQGSGFLQITEIFSSLEYAQAGMYILLIDEPDSHLHMRLQKNLINEFRGIIDSQLIIITHNDKFLDAVSDQEILFIDYNAKEIGEVKPLKNGGKNLILNNLIGVLPSIDQLRYVDKIILLEGKTDVLFFENMISKYISFTQKETPNAYVDKINGIDTLNDKLLTYSMAFKDLVPENTKWIVIRDSDCIPISKQSIVKTTNLGYLKVQNGDLIFQNGYGIESTFLGEIENFTVLLSKYYDILDSNNINIIRELILNQNITYAERVLKCTDCINKELNSHFQRQKRDRKESFYDKLEFVDMLNEINRDNLQYIMTKPILTMYLSDLHNQIQSQFSISSGALTADTIMEYYYDSINDLTDMFDSHVQLLESLF